MRKLFLLATLLITVMVCAFFSCRHNTIAPEKAIARTLSLQVDTFIQNNNKLLNAVTAGADERQLQ